jgi:hypothetical protein
VDVFSKEFRFGLFGPRPLSQKICDKSVDMSKKNLTEFGIGFCIDHSDSEEAVMNKRRALVGVAAALITTSFLGAPDMAAAATCGTTTLNNWLVSGFSCTVGDKTFSNFSYNPDGLNVPAMNVGVGPDALTGLPGLVFNADWTNGTMANEDAFIQFTVTAPAATPINDFHLALDGLSGPVTDGATLTLPGGALIATLSSSDNNLHSISFAPVQSLVVQDDIGVGPGGIVTSVHKSFSQVPGPIVGAGLPGLVAACGGLLALARRRRRRHIA